MNITLWTDPIVQLFALAVIGLLISRLMLRRRLTAHIVFMIALTALLLYHGIEPYAPDTHARRCVTPCLHRRRQSRLVDRWRNGTDQLGSPLPDF